MSKTAFLSVAFATTVFPAAVPALAAAGPARPPAAAPAPAVGARLPPSYSLRCIGYGPTAVVFQNTGQTTVPAGVAVSYRVIDPPHSGIYTFVKPLLPNATLKIDPSRMAPGPSSTPSPPAGNGPPGDDPGIFAAGLYAMKPCTLTFLRKP